MREEFKELCDLVSVENPEGMIKTMRRLNRTPYAFIRYAMSSLGVGNNVTAEAWVEHAFQYMDFYKNDPIENENFEIVCFMAKAFLMLLNNKKGSEFKKIIKNFQREGL